MYKVRHFSEDDPSVMRAYVADYPLASLIVEIDGRLSVNHVPMEFERSPAPEGRLLGHIARANPLWQGFESGSALAVFSGHQGYVSPDWYESKSSDPRVVPTWNYAAVHVSGSLRFFHDSDRLAALVERLTERFESARDNPWHVTDAPAAYIRKLLGSIVGVELSIDRMVGKWKLSQNRPLEDRLGVVAGLRREGGASGESLADLMALRIDVE